MATDTGQQDAFIREVDEEYRRDQMLGLWQRYGRWLVLGLGASLIALAALLFWREDQKRKVAAMAEAYTQALPKLETGDAAANAALADLASSGNPGYSALARLTQATAAQRGGDTAKALELYKALAADAALPQPLRDMAQMKAIRLEFDTQPVDKLIAALKPLAVPGGAWFGSAGEMLAMAYLRDGKQDMAGALFSEIAKDKSVPASLRARASQMAGMLGATPPGEDAVAATAPAGAETPAMTAKAE